jgi:protein tyrosine phosphatase (PTP) superfamily phosphohydrolase (DUF442 family)
MRKNDVARSFHRVGLTVTLCLLALAATVAPARVPETPGVSIKNFGKVNDHYYRGSQPRKEEVAQLKKLGIKSVIDLRKDSVREEAGWVKEAGMRYFNIPLKASTPATDAETDYFLSLVNNPANWPVYVHCKGGRHRTGALTAVYRITQDGWTADQAFKEMTDYEFNDGFFGGPAAQKKFVYSFYDRYRAKAAQGQK